MVLLQRKRAGLAELRKIQPLLPPPHLSPLLTSQRWQQSSGGPDDTDGGVNEHRVEPIHEHQRGLTGQRIGAAEAISQDVRAAVEDEIHLRHIQQRDLAFGCCAGGQHLDAADPVGAALVLQRRDAPV